MSFLWQVLARSVAKPTDPLMRRIEELPVEIRELIFAQFKAGIINNVYDEAEKLYSTTRVSHSIKITCASYRFHLRNPVATTARFSRPIPAATMHFWVTAVGNMGEQLFPTTSKIVRHTNTLQFDLFRPSAGTYHLSLTILEKI